MNWREIYENPDIDNKTRLLKCIPDEEIELRTEINNVPEIESNLPEHEYEQTRQLENIVFKFIQKYEDNLDEHEYKWISELDSMITFISCSRRERERNDAYDKKFEEWARSIGYK